MDKTDQMTIAAHTAGRRNGRQWMWRFLLVAVLLLAVVAVSGICLEEQAVVTDFSRKNLPPCLSYLFGTDWMGRDMLSRTLAGLSTSIRIGVLASGVSAVIALFLGTAAAVGGKWADDIISWCIDLMMGVPHIVLLLLISYALGKGEKGVIVGVAKGLRVIVIPATQKIYLDAMEEGLLKTFIEAGAVVSTPTCGPCLGGYMGILAEKERCISTTNRNFVGRMGHVESEIYLASPAVAAASAITGKISEPSELGL